ncbi:unnamed protein product [Auanema sp. JU1783]|nr:unnamed protein product [Auanema sp. JU1783]
MNENKEKEESECVGENTEEATTSRAAKRELSSPGKEVGRPSKIKKKEAKEDKVDDDFPMNVPFKVVNGVRHLSPYWAMYRTRTKGRWINRKMVEVFSQEFLSTNKNYAVVACKLGRISVNGKQITDVNYIFKNGDRIEHWGHRHEHPVKDYAIEVIAETEDLLVVNKPPSLPVHACGQYSIHTVLGQLRVHHGRTNLRVLHRLDRATSGVLLFAKNYETDLEFKQTLKLGEWRKEYVCKVAGVFPEGEVVCEAPIGTLVISMGIQCVRDDGKSAKSVFKRLWTDGQTSVCSVLIETGRTHQIRVHAQYLGHPIVGDQLYNTDVWGPNKGKNGEYGKGYDQLCEDVRNAHKASSWHETVDPDYEARMERMASEDLTPEPAGLRPEDRPSYDEVCLNCNVTKKEVPAGHFQLFLHCLRYETTKWSYETEMPEWARENYWKIKMQPRVFSGAISDKTTIY